MGKQEGCVAPSGGNPIATLGTGLALVLVFAGAWQEPQEYSVAARHRRGKYLVSTLVSIFLSTGYLLGWVSARSRVVLCTWAPLAQATGVITGMRWTAVACDAR